MNLDNHHTPCQACHLPQTGPAFYRYTVGSLHQFWCPRCRKYTTLIQKEIDNAPDLVQPNKPIASSQPPLQNLQTKLENPNA